MCDIVGIEIAMWKIITYVLTHDVCYQNLTIPTKKVRTNKNFTYSTKNNKKNCASRYREKYEIISQNYKIIIPPQIWRNILFLGIKWRDIKYLAHCAWCLGGIYRFVEFENYNSIEVYVDIQHSVNTNIVSSSLYPAFGSFWSINVHNRPGSLIHGCMLFLFMFHEHDE